MTVTFLISQCTVKLFNTSRTATSPNGEVTAKIVWLSSPSPPPTPSTSEKESSLKGNNLLPKSKLFPFRVDPFQKRMGAHESKKEVIKVVSLVKKADNLASVFRHVVHHIYMITGFGMLS